MSYRIHRSLAGVKVLMCLCILVCAIMVIPESAPVRAADAPLPDLIIEELSSDPVTPEIGKAMTVSAVIANRGEIDSVSCSLTFSIGEEIIHTTMIGAIPAGSFVSYTFTWAPEAGHHVMIGTIDPDNAVEESSETNNKTSYAFSVLAPDLVISDITWEPEIVSAGAMATFTVAVANRGNQSSRYGYLDFSIGPSTRRSRPIPALAPASSTNVTYTWIAQPGKHLLLANVDIWDSTRESDETNNTITVQYETVGPDLVIDKITRIPEQHSDSENITMSVIVRNQGLGSSRSTWLLYIIDSSTVGRTSVRALSCNQTQTFSYTWQPGSSNHTFEATIDPDDEIPETDEENNTGHLDIPAPGAADLVLQSISYTDQPLIGHPVVFTVTVKNNGLRTIANTDLTLYTNYNFNLIDRLGIVPPGATTTKTFSIIALDRELRVRTTVDANQAIPESNEDNNTRTAKIIPVHPAPGADLVVENLTLSPSRPEIGTQVTISAVVKNKGSSAAIGSFLSYYLDGEILAYDPVSRLEPGDSATVTFRLTADAGNHVVKAIADNHEDIRETDETNNAKEISFTTLAPDLVVKRLQWAPAKPDIGDTVTIVVIIENRGSSTSEETSLAYYVNGDSQGQHYISPIDPGDSVVRTFTWQAHVIPESFGAEIDTAGSVLESDEDNNNKIAPLPAPDLAIDDILPVPEKIEEGMSVNFTVTVSNNGGGDAGDASITASLDGIPLTSVNETGIDSGESRQYTFAWTAELGNHRFDVTADKADLLVESDETNNTASFRFSVSERTNPVSDNVSSENGTGSSGPGGGAPDLTLPEDDTSIDPGLIDYLNEELASQEEDEMPDTSESPPWWDVFTNLWFIIAVGVLGVVAIGVLLFLRTRASRTGETGSGPGPEPTRES